jgi:hypothetical protein
VTSNCRNSFANVKLNYPWWRNKGELIASCNGNGKPIIKRCKEGYVGDLQSRPVVCNIDCRGPTFHENPDNDLLYYECSWTIRGWQPKPKSCFRGQYFENSKRQCKNECEFFQDRETTTEQGQTTTVMTTVNPGPGPGPDPDTTTEGPSVLPKAQKSLLICFDSTGSMTDDLNEMRDAAKQIVGDFSARADKPIKNYVLSVFNDPGKFFYFYFKNNFFITSLFF